MSSGGRNWASIDPATDVARPGDLGDGSDGSGDNTLRDDGTWQPAAAGGPPSGPAGGDLSGTYPNPAVVDDSHSHNHDTTITGVSANDHHNQSHVLADGAALGADHTTSGLTAGWVLRATAAAAAKFMQLLHGDLGSVGADDHHAQLHHAAHEPSGGDAMAVDAAQATGSLRTISSAAPSTQAFGDSASAGAGTAAAPSTHKHAMPAAAAISSGLTMATARLLGRTTASSGALEEISVGAGLSLSGGVLQGSGSSAPIATGTSFPVSPATNDLFFRTDLSMIFIYNGTRWISLEKFRHKIGVYPLATSSITASQAPWIRDLTPYLDSGSDIWLETMVLTFYVGGGGTALGASHSWAAALKAGRDATNNTLDTITTITVNAGASQNVRRSSATINALLNNGTVHDWFEVDITKTGTPGSLECYVELIYRVVAT